MMMQGLARTDLTELSNAIPIVLPLLVTVLTNNLIDGMAFGSLSLILILILVATGRSREITGVVVWGLGVVFLAFFYVTTKLMQAPCLFLLSGAVQVTAVRLTVARDAPSRERRSTLQARAARSKRSATPCRGPRRPADGLAQLLSGATVAVDGQGGENSTHM
jgi:hypothetical protein